MFTVKLKCHMYFLIGWNFKYHFCTNHITFCEAFFFYFNKKYKMAAAEHISYDWVKENIINIIECSTNSFT